MNEWTNEWMNEWATVKVHQKIMSSKQAWLKKRHSHQTFRPNDFISYPLNYKISLLCPKLTPSFFPHPTKTLHTCTSFTEDGLGEKNTLAKPRSVKNVNVRKNKVLLHVSPWGNDSVKTDEDEINHLKSAWLCLFSFIFTFVSSFSF